MKVIHASELPEINKHPLDGQKKLLLASKGEMRQHTSVMHLDLLDGQLSEFRYANFSIDRSLFNAHEECLFFGCLNNPEPMLVISYALQGEVDNTFISDNIQNQIQRNQTAMTLITDDKKLSRRRLTPGVVESGHIYLPKKYIRQLAELYPEEVGKLIRVIENNLDNQALVEGYNTSPQLSNCLQSLFIPPILGNCSEDFMEQQIVDYIAHFTMCDNVNKAHWSESINATMVSKIHDALDILKHDFRKPLSIRSLAMAVGTNECYLKAGFRHEFHQSIYAYLFDYRMQMAIKYLRDTQKTIEEISMLVGYEYAAHFITAFKRRFRITPLEFRMRESKAHIL